MKEDREFQRIDVSIPCMVLCDDEIITGEITNISLSGAYVSQVSASLPEGSAVTLILQKKPEIKLKAAVDSKIIRSSQETHGDEQVNSFSLKFEEPLKDISNVLNFILNE